MAAADRDPLRAEDYVSEVPDSQNDNPKMLADLARLTEDQITENSDPGFNGEGVKVSVDDPITGSHRGAEERPGLNPDYDVSVALSGGGVRAALFGLGVLMATYDANKLPLRVSSVSGGSITNMMLADQYFSVMAANRPPERGARIQASRDTWERATLTTFQAICRGSLTRTWLALFAAFILGFPTICLILYVTQSLPSPLVLGPIFAAWLTVLFFRGHLIEALMAQRYLGKGWRGRKLEDLLPRDRSDEEYLWQEHVFCCTDLLIGRPVHFKATSGHRARSSVFRRTSDPDGGELPLSIRPWPKREQLISHGLLYDDPPEPPRLSGILRATAGFPGIPPRLFRWKRLTVPRNPQRSRDNSLERAELQSGPADTSNSVAPTELAPDQGFLSDGGIWNNLATEPFEDRFILDEHGPWDVLVSDASGQPRRSNRLILSIPGLAELTALIREETILANNTIGPRRQVYMRDVFTELRQPATCQADRLYLIVSCRETPEQLVERFKADFRSPEGYDDSQSTPEYAKERYNSVESRLDNVSNPQTEEHTTLGAFQCWSVRKARGTVDDPIAQYPTTLAAVPIDSALAIVARGYCNAALTLYLCNLSKELVSPQGWLKCKLSPDNCKDLGPGNEEGR